MTNSVQHQSSNNYKMPEKSQTNYTNNSSDNQFEKIDLAYAKNRQEKSLKTL